MRAVCLIRKEPYYRREAFEQGLKRVGFTLVNDATPNGPEDWLVVWNRKLHEAPKAAAWEARGGTVIVAENGYLQKTDKTYYAIGVHGHNGAGWFPVGDEDRFDKLGFEIKDWRTHGSEFVVRGQRGIGLPPVASPRNWTRITAGRLRQEFRVLTRPYEHPGDKGKLEKDLANLKDAKGLVIWSSAMGVRALVEGVPVWYASPKWVCAEGANKLTSFPTVKAAGRHLALHKMSHGQWHHEEIATGEPFQRIIEHRAEAIW
jgi:hypothetical protein